MYSLYLKERELLSKDELEKRFQDVYKSNNEKPFDEDKWKKEWNKLLKYLTDEVYAIDSPKQKRKMKSVNESDEEETNEEKNNYSVAYVGIIVYNNWLIKFFPKYFSELSFRKTYRCESSLPNIIKDKKAIRKVGQRSKLIIKPFFSISTKAFYEKFKQVIKVIKKYNKENNSINQYGNDNSAKSDEFLSIVIRLLDDYFENGFYENDRVIRRLNGSGEIDWNATVNRIYPHISDNRPIYFDYYTKYRESNTNDFFNRLHRCILTQCSSYLDDFELTDLLDLTTVELSEETLENFGDPNYILDRISKERSVQFNSIKLEMLDLMQAYISKVFDQTNEDKTQLFGTYSFQNIWEDVCKEVFDDDLEKRVAQSLIDNVKYHISIAGFEKNKTILDRMKKLIGKEGLTYKAIMEKPRWRENKTNCIYEPSSTLKLDCIKFDAKKLSMNIYDAKYYIPILEKTNGTIKRTPQIGDITKQYLYLLGYKDFAELAGIKTVGNYFLMPGDIDETEDWGTVEMDMFSGLFGELKDDEEHNPHIRVKKLSAKLMYDSYLDDKKNGIDIMNNHQDAIAD